MSWQAIIASLRVIKELMPLAPTRKKLLVALGILHSILLALLLVRAGFAEHADMRHSPSNFESGSEAQTAQSGLAVAAASVSLHPESWADEFFATTPHPTPGNLRSFLETVATAAPITKSTLGTSSDYSSPQPKLQDLSSLNFVIALAEELVLFQILNFIIAIYRTSQFEEKQLRRQRRRLGSLAPA